MSLRITLGPGKGQDKGQIQGYDTAMSIYENPEWAKSALGRSIPLFQSQENIQGGVLLIGGVHGDEPEGVELANKTLEWLKDNKATVTVPWTVIPCLNPDGILLGQRMNGRGVDLNRNYPSQDWSPEAKKPRYYPGEAPGTEPEVRALVQLIENLKPQLIIHCHSWNPCVVYAGEGAKKISEMLGAETGYEARDDIGYPTPGSLSSYAWVDRKIPVICIEEQEGSPRETVWPRFAKPVSRMFMEFADLF